MDNDTKIRDERRAKLIALLSDPETGIEDPRCWHDDVSLVNEIIDKGDELYVVFESLTNGDVCASYWSPKLRRFVVLWWCVSFHVETHADLADMVLSLEGEAEAIEDSITVTN